MSHEDTACGSGGGESTWTDSCLCCAHVVNILQRNIPFFGINNWSDQRWLSTSCEPLVNRGMYRQHHQAANKVAREWKRQASGSLVTLDHLWWRIRDHLDSYLEVADSEVRHVQASFMALSSYENCHADLKGLLQSYASSMSKMKKSHQKLKTTWREAGLSQ